MTNEKALKVVLLTREAYSDLCLRAAKAGDLEMELAEKKAELCEMRDATEQERKSIDDYVKSISRPTGFNVFNEPCEDAISQKIDEFELKGKTAEIWIVKGKLQIRCLGIIHNIPLQPVTPKPRTGKWVEKDEWQETVDGFEEWGYFHECSECGYENKYLKIVNFCPNCGAKMEGEDEDKE